MAHNIIIEALFAPGCESRDATLLMIDKVTDSQGITAALKETTISSIQEATQAKFLGSPSVRVNGRDIETESEGKTDYGVG
jgi:hypothetical protein